VLVDIERKLSGRITVDIDVSKHTLGGDENTGLECFGVSKSMLCIRELKDSRFGEMRLSCEGSLRSLEKDEDEDEEVESDLSEDCTSLQLSRAFLAGCSRGISFAIVLAV
jgi:hypothetical protein